MVTIELCLGEDMQPYVLHVRGMSKRVASQVIAGIDKFLKVECHSLLGWLPVYDGPSMGQNVRFVSRTAFGPGKPQQFRAREWRYGAPTSTKA